MIHRLQGIYNHENHSLTKTATTFVSFLILCPIYNFPISGLKGKKSQMLFVILRKSQTHLNHPQETSIKRGLGDGSIGYMLAL